MKIFAIRDESMELRKDLAYLFYYETEKDFFIEIPDDADPWEVPMILDSFVRRGEYTVNAYWSKIWVQQRIVPTDRQNLGMILKDNNLKEYDEFELLILAMGRCAQDDCYLAAIGEEQLPEQIRQRMERRIEDIIPLKEYDMLVFFQDGKVKRCSLMEYFRETERFQILLKRAEYYYSAAVQTGGYGVQWDVNLSISDDLLYRTGQNLPLSAEDFKQFIKRNVVNVAEAAELLGCTRQNIDYLTKTGKLHPVKETGKNTLYLRSEILKYSWR